ncbi:MAG: DUF2301 domain-containing membrane protein [Cyanobacteria bacterium J069]|nr:MAG: hypothetical protein D6742_08170 [Cyanobacteria bacterium J069]
MTPTISEPETYQGQFGEFTITKGDRQGVVLYRAALTVAAVCFAAGVALVLGGGDDALKWLSPLYTVFSLALGASLLLIHIYMKPLHQALQAFWLIGAIAAIAVAHLYPEPFVQSVYLHPQTIWGVGFTFAALTGIFFKEAFCFNRLETKLLTLLVPLLLLGHLAGILSPGIESKLLAVWAALMLVFALRKCVQAIPPDIGDKSVFDYLQQERQQA